VGIIGRFVAAVVTLTPVVFAPFALIFLVSMFLGTWRMLWVVGPLGLLSIFLLPFPLLCFAIPGLCWYQYRILCCTLRGRLLEGR
jgi:hypothetical protein